jgi:hypothetical protein
MLTTLINRRFKIIFLPTEGSKQATTFLSPYQLARYEDKSSFFAKNTVDFVCELGHEN